MRTMYTKVLVPLDGSRLAEQVLSYAGFLAESTGIPIELLRVDDPDVRTPFWPPLADKDYLQQVAARRLPSSLRIDCAEQVGKPAEVIVERAKADPGCLIAMATHGLSGIRRWLLGSVASKVAHATTNPLLFIRPVDGEGPAKPIELKTVFVPLDGSGLAEKILPHVVALAKKMKLEVHLVRVYGMPVDAYVVGDGVYMQSLAQQREMIQRETANYLEGKIQQLRAEGLAQVISTEIEGDPAAEIIDLACKTPNNVIAMSSHGRSGMGRWILGSVAEKVIHHSRDPVLVIRSG
jgi:nucleotide-binding universal stress UspA family protein